MQIPPALVLGCNTQHGLSVLSDWIQEQTGVVPDFNAAGWNGPRQPGTDMEDGYGIYTNIGHNGNGYGSGCGNTWGSGCGHGEGYGFLTYIEHAANGIGAGYDYGNTVGNGIGFGDDSV